MIEALNTIVIALQGIFNLVVTLGESIVNLVGYIADIALFIPTLVVNLPMPITALLTAWVAIMIIYAIKGS